LTVTAGVDGVTIVFGGGGVVVVGGDVTVFGGDPKFVFGVGLLTGGVLLAGDDVDVDGLLLMVVGCGGGLLEDEVLSLDFLCAYATVATVEPLTMNATNTRTKIILRFCI